MRDHRNCRNKKNRIFGGEIDSCKFARNGRVFISLQNMVSLLVLAHLSNVFLTDCTQKVPLFNLESPNDILPGFFP